MGRPNKKGRSKGGGQFIAVPHFLWQWQAWRDTTPVERALFLELLKRYNGRNNGALALSVRDAAIACNVHRDTVASALKRLDERGLVHLVTPGSFSTKAGRAAEYGLDHLRDDEGDHAGKALKRYEQLGK